MVRKRLNTLSSDKNGFLKAKPEYEAALKNAGYGDVELEFKEKLPDTQNSHQKKRRKRNIIYYNPPWNSEVKTNVGGTFF